MTIIPTILGFLGYTIEKNNHISVISEYHKIGSNKYPNIFGCLRIDWMKNWIYSNVQDLPNIWIYLNDQDLTETNIRIYWTG